jgi:hypothetical protein
MLVKLIPASFIPTLFTNERNEHGNKNKKKKGFRRNKKAKLKFSSRKQSQNIKKIILKLSSPSNFTDQF